MPAVRRAECYADSDVAALLDRPSGKPIPKNGAEKMTHHGDHHMTAQTLEERAAEIAFCMLGLSPEQRHQLLLDAFTAAIANHPDHVVADEPSPQICAFVAMIIAKIHELERGGIGTA
jgi:hypothetical protein